MYQNLRRALPAGAPESVHFCDIPEAEAAQVWNRTVLCYNVLLK